MRVYTHVEIDMKTGRVLAEEGYEYDGPVALCKGSGGGSSTTNTQDTVYNARMATIAEQQQAMAQEYFDFWKSDYKTLEQRQIQANIEMIDEAKPVREKFIAESLNGVDTETLAATARADAQAGASQAEQATARGLSRYGLNPDSGAFGEAMGSAAALGRSRLTTQAANVARAQGRDENYKRLAAAAGLGLG